MKRGLIYPMQILFIYTLVFCTYAHDTEFFENNYIKKEHRVQMRDGKRLFTAVYSPKDTINTYPILIWRTPYSVGPYGEDNYVQYRRETWHHYVEEGYIIVFQDVRGRFMSEGEFVNMRPYILNKKDNAYEITVNAS